MNRKRPDDDSFGRQVRSYGTLFPTSRTEPMNTLALAALLPKATSIHLAPPSIPHNATSNLTPETATDPSFNPGAPMDPLPNSKAPDTSTSSLNLISSHSAPSPQAMGSKHKITTGLKTVLGKLDKGTKALGGISLGMGELLDSLNVIGDEVKNRKKYEALRSDLESLWKNLSERLSELSLQMTASIENLLNGLQKEISYAREKCDRAKIRRYAEAVGDGEDILNCYQRVHRLLTQLSINAELSMFKVVDEQLASRLRAMPISEAARYKSRESTGLLRGKCTPNTRRNVIGQLHTWVDDPDDLNLYWLNGMAGTGKTTIAYSFCTEREEMHSLGASFFCSRSSASCNDATMIVPTIAYQLALFSRPFRSMLCKLLGEVLDICNRDVGTQFERMIVETLGDKFTHQCLPQNTVVVIDALDECSNQHDAGLLLQSLLTYASRLPIKFFISGRPEGAIHPEMMRNPALRSVFHLHEVEASFVQKDIELYVIEALDPIKPTSDQIAQLVHQAGRLFIYAATVIRYVKGSRFNNYSLSRLDSLLRRTRPNNKIDDLYSDILSAAFDQPDLDEQECADMRELLHTVVCAVEPLTVDALGGLLRPERPELVRDALQPFYSVLHISQVNGLVRVLHASFPDYLFSEKRAGKFWCNKERHNQQLSRLCLNQLGAVDPSFNICRLESSYTLDGEVWDLSLRINEAIPPELFYSCLHWLSHVEMGDDPEELKTLVYEFLASQLLLWMEIMNLKQCIKVGAQLLSRALEWCQKYCHNNPLVDLARDAYKFTMMFASSPASLSTPHIYISALALWPPDSPISVHYKKRMRGLVQADDSAFASNDSPLLARWSVDCEVHELAISPDDVHFAIINDYAISIWDTYTGRKVLGPLKGHTDIVCSAAYSPDGKHIVSGSYDRTILVWDALTGQIAVGPLKGHKDWVLSVAYSPDGTRIVSGSFDKTVRVWDASNGCIIYVLEGYGATVWSVSCSPDGVSVASGCEDGTIFVWGLRAGNALHSPLARHEQRVGFVVYSPDGTQIAYETGGRIFVLDAHTGQRLLGPLECDSHFMRRAAYSPDGSRICSSGCSASVIYIWDADSGERIASPSLGQADANASGRSSPDALSAGALAAYLPRSRIISVCSCDGTIWVWDSRVGKTWNSPAEFEAHAETVTSVSFFPDGTKIISGSEDTTVCVWDAFTGRKIIGPLLGHEYKVQSVACSLDTLHLVSVSYNGTLIVWDARTGKQESEPATGISHVQAVAYSADGSPLLISGSPGPTIYVWHARSRQLMLEMSENRFESVDLVASAFDCRSIFSSSYRTIHTWDVHTRSVAWSVRGLEAEVHSAAYSPSGEYIASGFSDSTFCVWNAQDGRREMGPIRGHTASVDAIAYSPDGLHIASGSLDGAICVWDALTGDIFAGLLRPHTSPQIRSIAFSPDSARIAAASNDGVIRVWCPARLSQEPQVATKLDEDGWMVDEWSRRLVWIPPDHRAGLLMPGEVLRISNRGSFSVSFRGSNLGPLWAASYITP